MVRRDRRGLTGGPRLASLQRASRSRAPALPRGSTCGRSSVQSPPRLPRHRQAHPKGFYCGDSPERINPGDHEHRLTTIKKVTSGSTPAAAAIVDALYREIITVGTHPATSSRVAEAANVIENRRAQ